MSDPNRETGLTRWLPALVVALFFVSGACGLIYEVAWTRMFAVIAGGTTRALTAVLAAYMGGLALGSYLGGRYVDRSARRPVLVYGVLEGVIGALALLLPLVLPALLPLLKIGRGWLGEGSYGFDLYRFFVCALALVLPTTVMGATFPVLLRGLLSRRERFGLTAGLLYGVNALGATAGALLSGFLLIPSLGLRAATWTAAGLNLLILALAAGLPALREIRAEAKTLEPEGPAAAAGPRWLAAALFWGYGLSGLCAMVYQVGWARALSLSLGNSTYALGLILAAYIGGLALGGILMTPLVDRLRRPLLWAAGLEIVIGLSALAVIPLFEEVTARMFTWAVFLQHRFAAFHAARFLIAFGLILIPTLAMGSLFPLAVKIAAGLRRGVGEPAGRVYAANTMGAIAGAFLAGYVLIRLWGIETSLLAAAGASVAVGMLWLLFAELRAPARAAAAAAAGAAALGILLAVPKWDPILMSSGPYLYARVQEDLVRQGAEIADLLVNYRLRYYREGVEATVAVLEARDSGERFLRLNGKSDASTRGDMPTQVLSAHLPLLLHPAPKRVMILGLASGVSAGSALLHPEVEQLDCVEISPEVVEASREFLEASRLDERDPRFHLLLDDARNYLALTDVRYDAVIIEPTNPWVAGLSTLWTAEFFALLAEHLEPDGLALMFLPAYDMNVDTVRMVLRTFLEVFPHLTVWESIPASDFALIGSRQPFRVDPERLQRRLAQPGVAADLARVGVSAESFFASFVLAQSGIPEWVGPGPRHTDDLRQLEFEMPKLIESPREPRVEAILKELFSRHQSAAVLLDRPDPALAERLARFDRARELYQQAYFLSNRGGETPADLENIIAAWREVLAVCGENFPRRDAARELAMALQARGRVRLEGGFESGARADWEEAFSLDPWSYQASDQLLDYYRARGDAEQTRAWALKTLDYIPGNTFALAVLGNLADSENNPAEAETWFSRAVESSPWNVGARWNLAVALMAQKKYAAAEEQFRVLLERDSDNPDYLLGLAYSLIDAGDAAAGKPYEDRARELAPEHPFFREETGNPGP